MTLLTLIFLFLSSLSVTEMTESKCLSGRVLLSEGARNYLLLLFLHPAAQEDNHQTSHSWLDTSRLR